MSKFEWITCIISAVLLVVAFAFYDQWDSERSKRIELEGHICQVDTVHIWIGGEELYFSPVDSSVRFLSELFDGDSIAVSTNNSPKITIPILRDFPDSLLAIPPNRPLLKKILEGNYIDSVGIGESRTWMRPRGTDSIIEVTE